MKPAPPLAPPTSVAPQQFGQPLNLSSQQPAIVQPQTQIPLIKPSPQAPSLFSSPMGAMAPGGSIFSGSLPNSPAQAAQTSQPSLFGRGGTTGSGSLFGGTPNFSAAFPPRTAAQTNLNYKAPATTGLPFTSIAVNAPNQVVSIPTASVASITVASAPPVNFSSGSLFATPPALPSYLNPPKPTFNLATTTAVTSVSIAPAKTITGPVVSQPLLATPKEPPILTLKQTTVAPLKQPDVATSIRSGQPETTQAPQITSGNDQTAKSAAKEDILNNEMLQILIKEDMKNFHSELQDLYRRCRNINLEVGTDDEKSNLVLSTESLLEFYKELQDTTYSQVSEVYLLKQALMQSFAWFEDAKARHRRYNDPNFSSMLQSQKLDPVSEKQLGDIQHFAYYIEAQLKLVDGFLDNQWSDFQDSCKKQLKGKMHIPTLEPIYQALVKQNAILQRHKYVIKDIGARIKSRNKKASSLPHVMNKISLNHVSGGIKIEEEIQKLKLDNEDVFSARYDKVSANQKKFSAAKQSKLCDFFTNRNVIHISPKKPKFVNNVLQNTPSKINIETSPRVQRSLRSTFDQIAHDTSLNNSLNTSVEANLSASNVFTFTLDKSSKTPEKVGPKTAASLLFDTPKAKPDNGINIPKPQSTLSSSSGMVFNFSAAVSPTKQQPATKSIAMNQQPQFQTRTFESEPVSSQSNTLIKPKVIKSTAVDSPSLFSSGDAKVSHFVAPQPKQSLPASSKPMFQMTETTTAAHPREYLEQGFSFGTTLTLGQQSTPKLKSTEAGTVNFGQMLSQMSTAISTNKTTVPLSGITVTPISSVATPGVTPKHAFSFTQPVASVPSLIANPPVTPVTATLQKIETSSIFSGGSKPLLNNPAPVQTIPSSGGSLFGVPNTTAASDTGGSIFGTTKITPDASSASTIFGAPTLDTPGTPTLVSGGGIFGAKNSTPSLPGGASTGTTKNELDPPSTLPNQSGSMFAASKPVVSTSSSIFGQKDKTPEVAVTVPNFSFIQSSATNTSAKPNSAFGVASQGSLFGTPTVSVAETTISSPIVSSFSFAQPSPTTTATTSSFVFVQPALTAVATVTTTTPTSSFGLASAATVTTSSLSFGQAIVSPGLATSTSVSLTGSAPSPSNFSFVQPVATESAKSPTLFGGTAATTATSGFGSPPVPSAFGSSSNGSNFSFGNLTVSALSPNAGSSSPPVCSSATAVPANTSSFSFATPASTVASNTLFGQPAATSSFMGLSICSPSTFSNPNQTTGSIFRQASITTPSTNIFAQKSSSTASPATNIFALGAKSIFGQATTPAPTSTSSLFGQTPSSPFGSPASASASGGSIFGQSAFGAPTTTSSIFGQPSNFGSTATSPGTTGSFSFTNQNTTTTGFSPPGIGFGPKPALPGGPCFRMPPAFGASPGFGAPAATGGSLFGSSSPTSQPAGASFGSPASFGTPSAFGQKPTFGSPTAFGQQSQPQSGFGSPPAFGGSPSFGSPQRVFGGPPTSATGLGTFGASQENSTFANLANQTTLGFGSLAQNQAAPPPQQPQFSG